MRRRLQVHLARTQAFATSCRSGIMLQPSGWGNDSHGPGKSVGVEPPGVRNQITDIERQLKAVEKRAREASLVKSLTESTCFQDWFDQLYQYRRISDHYESADQWRQWADELRPWMPQPESIHLTRQSTQVTPRFKITGWLLIKICQRLVSSF